MTAKRPTCKGYAGIPTIEDYSHWNEEAPAVWYAENRYDMEHAGEHMYDEDDAFWSDEDDDDLPEDELIDDDFDEMEDDKP